MSAPEAGLFSRLDGLQVLLTAAEEAAEAGAVHSEVKRLQALMLAADHELDLIGHRLRAGGWTFAAIGDLFGMSKQGAQYRFGKL